MLMYYFSIVARVKSFMLAKGWDEAKYDLGAEDSVGTLYSPIDSI